MAEKYETEKYGNSVPCDTRSEITIWLLMMVINVNFFIIKTCSILKKIS